MKPFSGEGLSEAGEIREAFATIQANKTGDNEVAWRTLAFIALETCFARIRPRGCRQDAEDVSQDILIALARRFMSNPEPIRHPPTYFRQTIHRASYRFLAEQRRDPLGHGRIELETCDETEPVFTTSIDPDRSEIRKLRSRLPSLVATVVRKRDRDLVVESLRGTKNVALAERYHLSEATVSRRLAKIAKLLRAATTESEVID